MPTTSDVLDQHLKCVGENMPLIRVKLIEEPFTPPEKKEIATQLTAATVSIEEENMPAATRVDIENILGDE